MPSSTASNSAHLLIGAEDGFNDVGWIDEVRIYNRVLTADEIKRLYRIGEAVHVNTQINNDSLQKGLVGWWTFDGKDMNATQALDRSGQGNNGTLTDAGTNTGVPTRVIGKLGQALKFDGVNAYLDMGVRSSGVANLSAVTVSAWINPRTKGGNVGGMIFEGGYGDPDSMIDGWNFRVEYEPGFLENTIAFQAQFSGPDLAAIAAQNSINYNQWQHVVATWDGSSSAANVIFYVNGEKSTHSFNQNGGSSVRADDSGEVLRIGRNNNGGEVFDGSIDEVRVYNRVLTADEIKRLYQIGGGR